ncbi:hypothetical protein K435DRAFT_960993 [Dendrothele bispora CBS 962.96]|uniref:Zn(2)-C6 fungal-type domain-containing protein n=1 Tax=Dendrothele bispora (strain CBS 962.96) TaxID=1314807 RepID=A0A4S8MRJ9_DENBC|nr:hypothetical protein K435DRAFT_960993 [Dendrothele bispora CBS 962.96]
MSPTSNLLSSVAIKHKFSKKKSCSNCRNRKIKCDRGKPCEACKASDGYKDSCEYDEDGQSTRMQQLQRRNASLEERLQLYENRYGTLSNTELTIYTSPATPDNDLTSSEYSSFENGAALSNHDLNIILMASDDDPAGPIFDGVQYRNFLNFSTQLEFFLDQHRLGEMLTHDEQSNTSSKVHQSLIDVMHLWSVRISAPTNQPCDLERHLLSQATQNISILGLSGIEPHMLSSKIVQLIQAHILLAQYLFRAGNILEGKYYAQGGLSLALSANLHLEAGWSSTKFEAKELHLTLPNAQDDVERRERVGAFWTSFRLYNLWATATQTTLISGVAYCAQAWLPRPPLSGKFGHLAKATVLWDLATRFNLRYEYGTPDRTQLERLEQDINKEIQQSSKLLFSLQKFRTQTLLHIARIELHRRFVNEPASRSRMMSSLESALNISSALVMMDQNKCILAMMDQDKFGNIPMPLILDPIFSVLWGKVAETLLSRMRTYRAWKQSSAPLSQNQVDEYIFMVIGFMSLFTVLENFSNNSDLFRLEARRVRGLYDQFIQDFPHEVGAISVERN